MARPDVDAAIRAIADANDGLITPEQVVSAAKSELSPLHPYFTWNVRKAAQEHWIDQARRLIRSVKVEISTVHITAVVPAYLRDPAAPAAQQGFTSLVRLRSHDDDAREAVINEFSRANAALARAKCIAVALGLADSIEEVREQILQLAGRASQEGAGLSRPA